MRRYLHPATALPDHAPVRDGVDFLQTARPLPRAERADPVRTALLIASALATLAVGCVAAKALLNNDSQQVSSIQAPR